MELLFVRRKVTWLGSQLCSEKFLKERNEVLVLMALMGHSLQYTHYTSSLIILCHTLLT